MISKESAKKASSEILNKEYAALRVKRRQTLASRYGNIFSKNLLLQYGDDPDMINGAIRYSHSKWQVVLAASVWVGLIFYYFYAVEPINVVLMLVLILGGGLVVSTLIRHYINVHLNSKERKA
ncbi:hypothetical protein [Gilvimarinus sp. DA14]|uniref:hypothetical protein n=1 Tax=Gilvimarinus sp. DA14 TaxID=2956798 RepID=UPI0020B80CFC|nr:hypothetical protein [Gilvimarinus sp. DA14]UTF60220.1 hypothetical protein NHM04_00050 [Gilvimarinus sp. DA14]